MGERWSLPARNLSLASRRTRDRRALELFRALRKSNYGCRFEIKYKHSPDKVCSPRRPARLQPLSMMDAHLPFDEVFRVRGDQESVSGRLQTKCVACRVELW